MANLSSLSKLILVIIAAATAALTGAVMAGTMSAYAIAALVVVLLGYGLYLVTRARAVIVQVAGVCNRAGWGDFESRITEVADGGELRDLQLQANHLIDRTDAFLRESQLVMSAIRDNRYFRRILPGGLKGAFLTGARNVNDAVVVIQNRVMAFNNSTRDFEQVIRQITDNLVKTSGEMTEAAERLEGDSLTTSERSSMVAAAAEETSANVQSVTASAMQLS
jgi:methyl-accepting chemotaxis protein